MFIENKYTKWYFSIVEKAKLRTSTEDTEKHHIIPRSLDGSNSITNLVNLTFKEHFICHLLLTKMVSGKNRMKMCYALKFMSASSNKQQQRYKLNSNSYKIVKNRFVEARKNSIHTEEARSKISNSMKGNSNKLGKYNSVSTNLKIREAVKGRTKIYREGVQKFVTKQELQNYLTEGWIIGVISTSCYTDLQLAKNLLRTDLKIKQISTRCNFSKSSNFCSWFKRQTNLTPTQYRLSFEV